ncbi:hypothetical protein [Chryseobacterium sp. Leaf180]|uniref:hypothetical protein n=1 Tax=Chryseobacterium sp. Leaf180 TaxID=1736289 RepID=UPI00103FB986|nr:hypothetical protein [Chryseobacterium sp. Leaf180]
MLQFILVLLGLAFGNHNSDTSCNPDGQVTLQTTNPGGGTDPGTGTGGDTGGDTGGETHPIPPKK